MSTRCNIVIREENISSQSEEWQKQQIYVYRHNDGSPDVVGKELERILNKYANNSLSSFEKLDILGSICGNHHQYIASSTIHADCEYIYVIDSNTENMTIKLTVYKTEPNFKTDSVNFSESDGYNMISSQIIKTKDNEQKK